MHVLDPAVGNITFFNVVLPSWQKKYKVETEIENWILKYDADMGEKQVD